MEIKKLPQASLLVTQTVFSTTRYHMPSQRKQPAPSCTRHISRLDFLTLVCMPARHLCSLGRSCWEYSVAPEALCQDVSTGPQSRSLSTVLVSKSSHQNDSSLMDAFQYFPFSSQCCSCRVRLSPMGCGSCSDGSLWRPEGHWDRVYNLQQQVRHWVAQAQCDHPALKVA